MSLSSLVEKQKKKLDTIKGLEKKLSLTKTTLKHSYYLSRCHLANVAFTAIAFLKLIAFHFFCPFLTPSYIFAFFLFMDNA